MRTDALIDLLARDAGPAPTLVVARRLSPAALFGLVLSAMLAVSVFGLVPEGVFATSAPWTKMAYAGALALTAAGLAARLSRPAVPLGRLPHALAAVILMMGAAGAVSVAAAPEGHRLPLVLGPSWWSCPGSVLLLALPALAAALWALRGLAPTRPRAAGFAAGLFAGSLGAFGYALSCPEPSVAFVAVWYSLGIAATGLLGAVLGSRVLRW